MATAAELHFTIPMSGTTHLSEFCGLVLIMRHFCLACVRSPDLAISQG